MVVPFRDKGYICAWKEGNAYVLTLDCGYALFDRLVVCRLVCYVIIA